MSDELLFFLCVFFILNFFFFFFFFFQAEDGIRDKLVTGVQTCALPILRGRQEFRDLVLKELEKGHRKFMVDFTRTGYIDSAGLGVLISVSKQIRAEGGELVLTNLNRSEERRVGKECRARWSRYHEKKNE